MKGLLVGVFFTIKGLFQFISATSVVSFAVPNIWNDINSVTYCGFGYYLFTITVGLIGLMHMVFSTVTVVWSYKYLQRDKRPFDIHFAKQYYENYIGTSCNPAGLDSPSDNCLNTSVASGNIDIMNRNYGATKDYYEMNISLKDSGSQDYGRLH